MARLAVSLEDTFLLTQPISFYVVMFFMALIQCLTFDHVDDLVRFARQIATGPERIVPSRFGAAKSNEEQTNMFTNNCLKYVQFSRKHNVWRGVPNQLTAG